MGVSSASVGAARVVAEGERSPGAGRLLLVDAHGVVGRVRVRTDRERRRLVLDAPELESTTPADRADAALQALIDHLTGVAHRSSVDRIDVALDAIAFASPWAAALTAAGFAPVTTTQTWRRGDLAPDPGPCRGTRVAGRSVASVVDALRAASWPSGRPADGLPARGLIEAVCANPLLDTNPALWVLDRPVRSRGYALGALDGFDREHGWIVDLGVAASHRRNGVGTALLAEVIGRLAAQGCRTVFSVTCGGEGATRLMQRCGFTAWGEPQTTFSRDVARSRDRSTDLLDEDAVS